MHDKLQGIKVMWEASSIAMILQSYENACLLAARAATERHNLIRGMKISKAEARKVMDRLNDLKAACQESRFNSVSTYLDDAVNLYLEILLQDIYVQ